MSLDTQHIEALARLLNPRVEFIAEDGTKSIQTRTPLQMAGSVLFSTDPAVHAAMLDALMRAGVLREEVSTPAMEWDSWELVKQGAPGRLVQERRLVTKWDKAELPPTERLSNGRI